MQEKLKRLNDISKEISLLENTTATLHWDQETYMPETAIDERSEQLSLLQGMIHDKSVSPEVGELLASLGASDENPFGSQDLSEQDRALVRRAHKTYRDNTKLPKDLVVRIASHTSKSQAKWAEAKEKSEFSIFEPYLETMLDLEKEQAEALGYEEHIYDALLDQFEPWTKTSYVKKTFDDLQPQLTEILKRIAAAKQVDDAAIHRTWNQKKQDDLGRYILSEMQYDFKRGRMDEATHPFTITLGRDDVRLTTRYQENFFNMGMYGTMHEGGHGLYEQGIPGDWRGTALGECASLAIHESQSRFWENTLGRSQAFWNRYFPKLKELFPENTADMNAEKMYRAVNKVEPSFIRVEADEVTYNLHIILRFRIELMMMEGQVKVKELPDLWRSLSQELLGITPKKDSDGVLQDVHWSFGGIGYFPTYALGNLYSAQFSHYMQKDLDLDALVEAGKLDDILQWLRTNIHSQGAMYSGPELCKKITGEDLNAQYFLDYIQKKYSDIYAL